MAIEKLTIETFLQLSNQYLILDVRSPGEYKHAHIPGAYNLPLFSDEERRIVGTAYTRQNRETAIKLGLDFFGIKMRRMIEEIETLHHKVFLVHCWRGGVRSAGISWLLDLYGYKVYTLIGGYKSFRRLVLETFSLPVPFRILAGFTGSGKTPTLIELEKQGESIIDLEDLANHKGSAFGDDNKTPQPTQEMFENRLSVKLLGLRYANYLWIEDESQRIGALNIPQVVWNKMKQSPVYFLDIPLQERLIRIVLEYGNLDKEFLIKGIQRIQKRLGGLEAKLAISLVLEDKMEESFLILLKYYDKCYGKALMSREKIEPSICRLECRNTDVQTNTKNLLKNILNKTALA